MKVKPFQFMGPCASCGKGSKKVRGGIEITTGSDDSHDWICLRCAKTLAERLLKSIASCKERVRQGEIFRFDRWRMKEKKS